ncbi:malonic semialdehyde reductase [Alphaproteobacteria bacterium]|nr:malonic semialdehyde reductase [Alphaproteobacteria bacterium]
MTKDLSRTVIDSLDSATLDLLFGNARTHNVWQDRTVSEIVLRRLFDLMKMAPTSMNISPARIIFVKTEQGKEKLKPALVSGNVEKTMTAPVCAIIGHDLDCWKQLPKLFPFKDMSSLFNNNADFVLSTAFRNCSMQGAYLIMAARALGLDCGPMSGFDNDLVDKEFFSGTAVKSNFLCNIGYGRKENLSDRAPRFNFEDVCQII